MSTDSRPVPQAAQLPPEVITTTGLTKVYPATAGARQGLKAVDGLDL